MLSQFSKDLPKVSLVFILASSTKSYVMGSGQFSKIRSHLLCCTHDHLRTINAWEVMKNISTFKL